MTRLTDDLFTALSDRHRRRILACLLESDSAQQLIIPEEVYRGDTDLQTLHMALFHTHLPKLSNMGFVDWNRGSHIVTPGPRFEEIGPFLEVLYDNRESLPGDWD